MSLEKQINETLDGIMFDVEGLSGHLNADIGSEVTHAELSVNSAQRLLNKAINIHAMICRRTAEIKKDHK